MKLIKVHIFVQLYCRERHVLFVVLRIAYPVNIQHRRLTSPVDLVADVVFALQTILVLVVVQMTEIVGSEDNAGPLASLFHAKCTLQHEDASRIGSHMEIRRSDPVGTFPDALVFFQKTGLKNGLCHGFSAVIIGHFHLYHIGGAGL